MSSVPLDILSFANVRLIPTLFSPSSAVLSKCLAAAVRKMEPLTP